MIHAIKKKIICRDSKNLFNKSDCVLNSTISSDGTIQSNENCFYNQAYFPAGAYLFSGLTMPSGSTSVQWRVCEYDSDYTFLRRTSYATENATYVSSADCVYLRLTMFVSLTNIQTSGYVTTANLMVVEAENLFDYTALPTSGKMSNGTIEVGTDGYFVVTDTTSAKTGNVYGTRLRDYLLQNLEVGKTYYLSVTIDGDAAQYKQFYIYGSSKAWAFNSAYTVAEADLTNAIGVGCYPALGGTTKYKVTIVDTESPAYEPYGLIPVSVNRSYLCRESRNLFKESWTTKTVNNVTITGGLDGSSIGTSGTASATLNQPIGTMTVEPNSTFTLHTEGDYTGATYGYRQLDSSGSIVVAQSNITNTARTVTLSDTTVALAFFCYVYTGTATSGTAHIMVEEGSTATAYEPYGIIPVEINKSCYYTE